MLTDKQAFEAEVIGMDEVKAQWAEMKRLLEDQLKIQCLQERLCRYCATNTRWVA